MWPGDDENASECPLFWPHRAYIHSGTKPDIRVCASVGCSEQGEKRMRPAVIIAAFLLTSGCDRAQNGQAGADAVRAANAAKDKAMIARDAARLGQFYTDDYLLIDDDAQVHDKADQVRFMTENVELLSARSDDVQVTMLSPDAALVTGRLAGRYRMDDRESDYTERYTGVWLRQGQEWRVKHEHGSLVPAAE